VAWFWMVGSVISSGLAWLIIPREISWHVFGFPYDSWRVFVAVAALPSFISSVTIYFAPESPRWCLTKNRMTEARKVLSQMYLWNKRTPMPSDMIILPIVKYRTPEIISSKNEQDEVIVFDLTEIEKKEKWYSFVAPLFRENLRRSTIGLIIVWFTLSFGFYGLTLWMPEFFLRSNLLMPTGFNAYVAVFVSSLANIPGNIISVFSVDIVGRKWTLAASMVLSGISVFFIFWINNAISVTVMSCVFAGLNVPAWNALDILSAELFPTNIRASAMGLIMVVGRIGAILGNLVFGEFIEYSVAIPLCTTAACLFIGGVATTILPDSGKTDLED